MRRGDGKRNKKAENQHLGLHNLQCMHPASVLVGGKRRVRYKCATPRHTHTQVCPAHVNPRERRPRPCASSCRRCKATRSHPARHPRRPWSPLTTNHRSRPTIPCCSRTASHRRRRRRPSTTSPPPRPASPPRRPPKSRPSTPRPPSPASVSPRTSP